MTGLPYAREVWMNRRGRFTGASQTGHELRGSVNAVGGGFIPTLLFEGGGVEEGSP